MIETASGGLGELCAEKTAILTPEERRVWDAIIGYMREHGVGIRAACKACTIAPATFFRARRKLGGRASMPGPIASDEEAFGYSENDAIRPDSSAVQKPMVRRRRYDDRGPTQLRDSIFEHGKENPDEPTVDLTPDEVLLSVLNALRCIEPLERRRILEASRVMLGMVDASDMRITALGCGERASED